MPNLFFTVAFFSSIRQTPKSDKNQKIQDVK